MSSVIMRAAFVSVMAFVFCSGALVGCGPDEERAATAQLSQPLGAVLVISEVAQSTAFAGSTADKVEVFCASATGCPSYRVCDPSAAGTSCSALQSAMLESERRVISRGTSITLGDEVWLVDSSDNEIADTRVGPFDCSSGQSRTRPDCSAAGFGGCGVPDLGASAGACEPHEPPEDFAYSLKFTTNQYGGPESTCDRPLCQELIGLIDSARSSIDFAVYGLRAQQHVIDALVAAQGRGVSVRGVVDGEDASCTTFAYPDTQALIDSLAPGSVVCDTGPGYSYIMHNKFFVFDDQQVWTGSTNLSDTELGGEYNSDVAATITSSRLSAIYTTEMDEMFGGLFHNRKADNSAHLLDEATFTDGTTVIQSYFSPTDDATANAVIPLIDAATQSLDIAMFFLTSQAIADAVLAARARGVAVRVIIDAGGASNAYSKTIELCAAGIPVKAENWGGKSHSKWAVADSAIPNLAATVFGSMNFTAAGNSNNDENTLYVRNANFAADFQSEFDRQWALLAGVPSCTAVSAEGADSSVCGSSVDCSCSCASGSCCDGSDNDYDGKSDLDDEGCACADGVDNDADGYTDTDDWECRVVVDPTD
jgi:phosphatidylserine/phosphatidylglycerophosphate/cardiolipin synthase-like enzyme